MNVDAIGHKVLYYLYCTFYIVVFLLLCIHVRSNISSYYSVIWILEPFLLTIISICFLALSLTDYLVPIAISVLCNPQNWTGQKEKKLIEISQNVSATLAQIKGMWNSFLKLQLNHPHMVHVLFIFDQTTQLDHSCLTDFLILVTVQVRNDR